MLLVLLLSVSLPAKSIKLAGTFDLNANNNSELLLLKGGGLQYVEIEAVSYTHLTLPTSDLV